MSDEAILQIAVNDTHSQEARGVPLGPQKSFEEALEDAEKSKKIVQRNFSRKGGRARKNDELQDLIEKILRRNPNISTRQLLLKLRRVDWVSIDGGSDYLPNDRREIHFKDCKGMEKTAPVSGLKDRLSRAKAKRAKNKIARTG